MSYYKCYVSQSKLKVAENPDAPGSYDIMLDGIEIGSYGHRTCLFCNWIYGTGLAEPRFSRINRNMRK
jgi:hypothetical protein